MTCGGTPLCWKTVGARHVFRLVLQTARQPGRSRCHFADASLGDLTDNGPPLCESLVGEGAAYPDRKNILFAISAPAK
jgi:hypothetical protein